MTMSRRRYDGGECRAERLGLVEQGVRDFQFYTLTGETRLCDRHLLGIRPEEGAAYRRDQPGNGLSAVQGQEAVIHVSRIRPKRMRPAH